jgi:hypothetical protein
MDVLLQKDGLPSKVAFSAEALSAKGVSVLVRPERHLQPSTMDSVPPTMVIPQHSGAVPPTVVMSERSTANLSTPWDNKCRQARQQQTGDSDMLAAPLLHSNAISAIWTSRGSPVEGPESYCT